VEERPVLAGSDIVRDEVIVLNREKEPANPMRLRRIEVWLEEKQKTIVFITTTEGVKRIV
ncbi:MAG: hypothetical protein H7Y20_09455, partial [Bryobacteraceae bacterium]|nr:hypothetical protein [Bryobacteraceae bacterium]